MKGSTKQKLLFIIPSTLGVLLFMVPILVNGAWTIAVKVLADIINGVIGSSLPLLCTIILTIYAVLALAATLFKPKFITDNEVLSCRFLNY